MSATTNSANPHSSFCAPAEVRLASRWPWPQSDFKLAYVLVSSRIYWKVVNEDATNKPQSFLDFRNEESLELVRLDDDRTWDDVDSDVKVDSHNGKRRITVCGRPHGRTRRNNGLHGGNVRVEIISNTPEQVQVWLKQLRARIVPWNLLEQEVKDIARGARSSTVKELEEVLGVLVANCDGNEQSSMSTGEAEGQWSKLPENMAKLSIVDKLTAQAAGAVGSGATLAALGTRVQSVAETAKLIGDISKFVAGVSSIFHLVSLGAQGISMCAEAKRGQTVLPIALSGMSILLEYVLESMTEVMMPSRGIDNTDIEFVFDALKQTVCTVDKAETQLLRGRGSQILNAEDVKKVEKKLGELRHMAVTAGNTSWICTLDKKLSQLEKQLNICDDGVHHVRPSLSAFFSGRKRELSTLKNMLENFGSAVITQYGGVGKTELMIAFADQAERDKSVSEGVLWVSVDGSEKDVIETLARLAEKLTRRKMDEEERRNPNLIVQALKQGLDARKGRWLLCLDNADDSKVSGILNEVCGIVGGTQGNGWILVTSRQGQPHIWSRMKKEQRLVLEPLCSEDAMVVLWRQIEKIETDERDDEAVMKSIEELEKNDTVEYKTLKELCGDEGGSSFEGLPLALVQAGSYIARFECSFAEYQNMFKNASRIEDMQDIMRNTEDVRPIQEAQRSIWTTWKISVERLSKKAYTVLRAMAMIGPCGVRDAIVKGILEAIASDEGKSVDWMFRKVVIEELVHGSSLIYRNERDGQDVNMYRMHRLVRRFIVSDMDRGSKLWNQVYSLALFCVHEALEAELEKEGKTFKQLPVVFNTNHREIVAHAIALVHQHSLPAQEAEILHVSQVENIHRYSGQAMEFLGKVEEEVQVWKRLVDILEHQRVTDRSRNCNQLLLHVGHKEEPRVAAAYNSLGRALTRNGQFNDAASKHEQSLEMRIAIHGSNRPHPDIAMSLDSLGNLYRILGKLDKALENHEKSLQMKLAIHGSNKPHPAIATSLNNLGLVYEAFDKLDKALEKHEGSLEMRIAIHGSDKPHPDIATSLSNLGNVYQRLGKLDKALENHERSLGMELAIHGPNKPHPDIATSLSNLGNVYRRLGKLDKALDKHKKSLEMEIAIHGTNKPMPDIAISLWHIGRVYHQQKNLDQAAEFLQQSLEMLRTVHGGNSLHPHITKLMSHLAEVYKDQERQDEALPVRELLGETGRTTDGEASNRASGT